MKYRDVLINLSFWLNSTPRKMEECVSEKDLAYLDGALRLQPHGPREQLQRKIAHDVTRFAPSGARLKFMDMLKSMRQRKARLTPSSLKGGRSIRIIKGLGRKGFKPRKWFGKRYAVCITHDVDYKEGFLFLDRLLEMDRKHGIRASYGLVPKGIYPVASELKKMILGTGNCIYIHGYEHDIGFSYRSEGFILKRLKGSQEIVGIPGIGYRSPACSVSDRLFSCLTKLGIAYDSSLESLMVHCKPVEVCYPYLYPGTDIIEIPITIQDDTLFRDMRLQEDDAFSIAKRAISEVKALNGVAVINTHPLLIKRHPGFYQRVLELVSSDKQVHICNLQELYKEARKGIEGCRK